MKVPLPIPRTQSEIAETQSARKRVVVDSALQSPFHRRRLKAIRLDHLDDPAEWRKIPILTKDELRALSQTAYQTEFCIGAHSDICEYWRSGGVTGAPLFYPRSFTDMKYGLLSFRRAYGLAGIPAGSNLHDSFPLGIHPVGQVYARAAQAEGIGVNWAGAGTSTPSATQVRLIEQLRPDVWMGMSSYALHLANLADAEGIDLANSSVTKILCSAEPLSDTKRDKIERMWGAQVFDTFGMTEAGLMGAEGPQRDGFRIWTDMYHIEVLDDDFETPVPDGTPGNLVVTPLWTHNVTPFLRWSSGDVVILNTEQAGDGPYAVFPRLKHAHRTAGFFKIRGVNINHAEFEDFVFADHAVADFKVELVTLNDREILRLSVELVRDTDTKPSPNQFLEKLGAATKQKFEVNPDIVLLARGTLAQEFESSVKAPRFTDLRT